MNQKVLVTLLAVLAAAALLYSAHSSKDEYLEWKQRFGYTWTEEEDSFRRLIFQRNLEAIQQHNRDQSQTYTMGVNQFTGLTDMEFVMTYLSPRNVPATEGLNLEAVPVNADVDWTTQGKVSPIKNQGSCGSCWAFSATGVLESWALFKGQKVSLSEQQLVDCSKSYGNDGCNGGFNYQGLAYVKDNGIASEGEYAYTAKTQACKAKGGSFKISNVITTTGCDALAKAIQLHPVGVSCDATNWSRYSSGIFNNCKTNLNHDILLVGMTSAYYKVKNSWGSSWGEQGFIRLAPGNTCGICIDKSPWVA
jgi:cathepsin L